MNDALPVTPCFCALARDRVTMSGLYSTPMAVAPRFAAMMTVRPSPEPRSMTRSCGVTFAISSIFWTSCSGDGTHTTSLPACPTVGSNGLVGVCVCADSATAKARMQTDVSARFGNGFAFIGALLLFYSMRDAVQFEPWMVLPFTRPVYDVEAAVKLICSPVTFPLMGVVPNDPEIIWN